MVAISRAERAALGRRAREIRQECERQGMGVPQVAEAILQQVPGILPLEAFRLARGWSRERAVAELVALYESEGRPVPAVNGAMLCRWEHAAVGISADYRHMLCRLYGVSPEQLHPGGAAVPAPVETPRHLQSVTERSGAATFNDGSFDEGTDPMQRRTLLTAAGLSVPLSLLQRLDDALAVPPQAGHAASPAELVQMLRSARRQFDVSELTGLIAALPGLLASAREVAGRVDTPAGWALASASYNLATDALNKIGNKPSARITADRAVHHAERSEDAAAKGAAARALGMMLRAEGRPDLAVAVMSKGADELTATGLRKTAEAATHLRLLCARAYTYAWAGDRSRALEGIAEAERAAARIPAMLPFTILYRVDIHYALGDAGTALHAARNLRSDMFSTPERRGRLHTDLARAWWQWGKPEQTTAELLAAHRYAPAEVRDRPSIRKIAAELVERHPRTPGVRHLAASLA